MLSNNPWHPRLFSGCSIWVVHAMVTHSYVLSWVGGLKQPPLCQTQEAIFARKLGVTQQGESLLQEGRWAHAVLGSHPPQALPLLLFCRWAPPCPQHHAQQLAKGTADFVPVLVLAGIELFFFLVVGIVLCFGFSRRIMLITHWCF